MPWELYEEAGAGKRFRHLSITDALAAVTAGTMARVSKTGLYTSIVGLWGHVEPPTEPVSISPPADTPVDVSE
jgi:hypothetical protein